ncbi:unnamed protein product [Ambrosiozyma monospora]|uniref:Unnamed protein product n=1 Tax=Ambrosiozyma monospora TaxID=43982 RepID=A0ACB5TAR3_AMBMO|nr:unnamed protein product [Ambrosiozyma monospora]
MTSEKKHIYDTPESNITNSSTCKAESSGGSTESRLRIIPKTEVNVTPQSNHFTGRGMIDQTLSQLMQEIRQKNRLEHGEDKIDWNKTKPPHTEQQHQPHLPPTPPPPAHMSPPNGMDLNQTFSPHVPSMTNIMFPTTQSPHYNNKPYRNSGNPLEIRMNRYGYVLDTATTMNPSLQSVLGLGLGVGSGTGSGPGTGTGLSAPFGGFMEDNNDDRWYGMTPSEYEVLFANELAEIEKEKERQMQMTLGSATSEYLQNSNSNSDPFDLESVDYSSFNDSTYATARRWNT